MLGALLDEQRARGVGGLGCAFSKEGKGNNSFSLYLKVISVRLLEGCRLYPLHAVLVTVETPLPMS